jgi:hypothetical protein
MSRCPSDLELESLVRSPSRRFAHTALCPRCAARLAELSRLGEEFERDVFPTTVEAVIARSARRGVPRRLVWLAPLAAMAAAAVVVLVRWPTNPPDRYVGVKGPPLVMVAYASAPDGAHALSDGEIVPAGAGLRFEVRPARSCRLWIVSADARGQVSRIFPAAGPDGVAVAAGGPVVLKGGAVLDGQPGPERFFAVCGCGDDPIYFADVERAARVVGRGEERVRAARQLPGLPADTLQATLLVEKRP